MPSRLDSLYRSLLLTKFFCKGWGRPDNLQRLFEFKKIICNREACRQLVNSDYPVEIIKDEKTSDCRVLEGKFLSPLAHYLPEVVPEECRYANFQILLPNKWKEPNYKPMCIQLAGTGDHYFWKRRNLVAKPLMKEGNIGSIILENPFYGTRKPAHQKRSSLENVSDIFVMGGCLVLECLVLFHWCERNGFGPLGVTGLSMGGHMASLAATNWHKPLCVVPCLSWSTASNVFTNGVMAQSINWDVLDTQYFNDGHYREKLAKMVTIVDDAFLAGQRFVKQFNKSILELKDDIQEAELNKSNSNGNYYAGNVDMMDIDRTTNNLNISPALLEKLLSKTGKCSLSKQEINELNEKIREAQKKWHGKLQSEAAILTSKNKTVIDDHLDALQVLRVANGLEEERSSNNSSLASFILGNTTKLMRHILPQINAVDEKTNAQTSNVKDKKEDSNGKEWWERESLQFMRGVMDECTHLKNFSVPFDTELIISICATDDGYIPRADCVSLDEIWPGAEVRYLDAGHVSAYVLHQKMFRSAIIETFTRARRKYPELLPVTTTDDSNKPFLTADKGM